MEFTPMSFETALDKLILDLFEIEVFKFGNFKLSSGIFSPVYIDLRVIISFPQLLKSLTDLLVHFLQNSDIDHFDNICGVPYTALPLATLLSAKINVPMLIRRKETKDYGTKKKIEGKFKKGEKCIIIEDVITSGSSVMETIKDIENEDLKVNTVVVILDREQGGIKNLKEKGINVYPLTSITKVMKILLKNKKISEETVKEVEEFLGKNIISLSNHTGLNSFASNRLGMSFTDRIKFTKNELSIKIFQLMELKKTNLCLAADVTQSSDLLELAAKVGPHICILKTHSDAVKDFSENTYMELLKLAKTHNFLIMEDRKFSDIGNTVSLQYNKIKEWTNLVTVHSIAGEGILTGLKSSIENITEKGCFLVAELSCKDNLINNKYAQETLKMAEKHADYVVGLVCQSPDLIKVPYLIQLTPGVNIEEKSDNLGQNYNDPEFVVLQKGADIAVVGRGIILSAEPEKTALIYKQKLWKAYQNRISQHIL